MQPADFRPIFHRHHPTRLNAGWLIFVRRHLVSLHPSPTEATYHRWRNQFGGLKAEDA
jgi:hypothetical protein